jgi:hypothetical protein
MKEFRVSIPEFFLVDSSLISLTKPILPICSDILRTMQTSEDRSIYDKVVNAIFDKEMSSMEDHHHHVVEMRLAGDDTSIQYTDLDTEVRDCVFEVTREVFRQHCAKRLEIIPMRLLDDSPQFNRFLTYKTPRNLVYCSIYHSAQFVPKCRSWLIIFKI